VRTISRNAAATKSLVGLAGAFAIGILLNVLAAFIQLGGGASPSAIVLIVGTFHQ
jgi:hypothetical protein